MLEILSRSDRDAFPDVPRTIKLTENDDGMGCSIDDVFECCGWAPDLINGPEQEGVEARDEVRKVQVDSETADYRIHLSVTYFHFGI